jgi:hypothetical protein
MTLDAIKALAVARRGAQNRTGVDYTGRSRCLVQGQ